MGWFLKVSSLLRIHWGGFLSSPKPYRLFCIYVSPWERGCGPTLLAEVHRTARISAPRQCQLLEPGATKREEPEIIFILIRPAMLRKAAL